MRKQKIAFIIFFGILILAGFSIKTNKNKTAAVRAENEIYSGPQQQMTEKTERPLKMPEPTQKKRMEKISVEEINSLHRAKPLETQVNEDLKANPHSPSKTLMTFAKKMGPLMEKSINNEDNANILVPELKACALDESMAKAARALCVQDTEELSEIYPGLKEKASELRANVSPEVQKILNTNDASIKK